MKTALSAYLGKALAAAATVTGKKFGLLVATSLIATSGIVASVLAGAFRQPPVDAESNAFGEAAAPGLAPDQVVGRDRLAHDRGRAALAHDLVRLDQAADPLQFHRLQRRADE